MPSKATFDVMRLRRRYNDMYLARGRARGKQPLRSPDDLDEGERKKIEQLSFRFDCLKVLDPHDREFGHYAIEGQWRLLPEAAITEGGDFIRDTELCETYGVAFVVERGSWYSPEQWQQRYPDHYLARVALAAPDD